MLIETINLSKKYPGGGGCRDISLEIAEGEVFALLGPNGAGKSTFIKMLLGLVEPTSGSARILGRPLGDVQVRRQIGFLPENFHYHQWMQAREVIMYHGQLYGLSRQEITRKIPEVLANVKLSGRERQRVATFSKGMQQRLGLGITLLNNPKLVFLDEPTSALDPIGRRHVRELIQELRRRGTAVFLNSHLLSEVEMVSDRVAVIKEGALITQGTLDELLKSKIEVEIVMAEVNNTYQEIAAAWSKEFIVDKNRLLISLDKENQIPQLVKALVEAGGQIYSVTTRKNSLEDIFVKLIGEEAEDYA